MVQDLVYDLGMNDGRDTAYYLAAGFRVIAIEADPRFTDAAKKRFESEIKSGRLTVLNVGISDHSSTAEFWINEAQPDWSSFDRAWTTRVGDPHHSILIQCRRLDDILAEFGIPYFLKIDIEGYDIVCCDQIPREDKPKFVSVEMSQVGLIDKLNSLGYDRFKLVRQYDFYSMVPADATPTKVSTKIMRAFYRAANYHKKNRSLPLRVGRGIAAQAFKAGESVGFTHALWRTNVTLKSKNVPDWEFVMGTSGPFGDETPGEWLTAEQAREIWRVQSDSYRKSKFELWCDLHATCSE